MSDSSKGKSKTNSEKYFQALIENISDYILVINADYIINYATPSFYKTLGYSTEETIGKSVLSFIHSDDREKTKNEYEQLKINPELIQEVTQRLIHKDGSVHYVNTKRKNLLGDSEIEGIILKIQDITDRVNAELSLKESEIKFRVIVPRTPHHIIIQDRDLRYTFVVNPQLGLTVSDMIGKTDRDFLKKEDAEKLTEIKLRVMETREPVHFETSLTNINGEVEYFDGTYIPKLDSTGQPEGIFGVFWNDTERKHMEEALRKSNENLQVAQRLSNIGSWSWIIATNNVQWSDELCRINKYDRELSVPSFSEMSSYYTPESWKILNEAVEKSLETGLAYELELDLVRTDGILRRTLARGEVDYDVTGKILGMHGTVQDITERKQIEEALRESEAKYRLLFETSADGIGISEIKTKNILYVNPAICQMFGYTEEQFLKMNIMDCHPFEAQQYIISEFKSDAMHNGKTILSNVQSLRKDGTTFYADIDVSRITIDKKECTMAIFRDITERKRAEEELIHSEERLKKLVEIEQIKANELVEMNRELKDARVATLNIIDDLTEEVEVRRRAEELLKESELKFRTVADYTYDWGYWENESHQIVYMTPSCEKITGYTQDEFLSDPSLVLRIVYPEDLEIVDKHHKEVFLLQHINNISEFEFRIVRKDGLIVDIYHICRPIYDENGKYLGRRISNRDITERKKAEETLKQSETKYREIFENIYDVFYQVNTDGTVIEISPSIERMTGYSRQELIGNDIRKIYENPKDRVKLLEQVYDSGKVADYELNLKSKNNILIYCSVNTHLKINPEGKIIGLEGSIRDITERKKAEIELKRSQDMLKRILNQFPGVVFWKDRHSVYLGCNDSFALGAGLSDSAEIIGKTDNDLPWAKSEADLYRSDDQRIMQSKRAEVDIIEKQTQKENTIAWFATSKTPLLDTDGNVIGILGTSHDITKRVHAEEMLRENEKKYHTLFTQSPEGILLIDKNGNFVEFNDITHSMLGYTREEFAQINIKDISVDSIEKIQSCIENLLSNGKVDFETKYKTKNGNIRDIHVNSSTLVLNGVQLFHSIWEDITERKKVELELAMHRNELEKLVERRTMELHRINLQLNEQIEKEKEIEKMLQESLEKEKELSNLKSSFISTVSHEFRTPLTLILSNTELLQINNKNTADTKFNTNIGRIINSVDSMTNLLDEVLTINRAESGKVKLQLCKINLLKMCEEVIKVHQENTGKKHKLSLKWKSSDTEVVADEKIISKILNNLIGNAVKYSEIGSKIEIMVNTTQQEIRFQIIDSGLGIDKDDLPHLFEPFYRGKNINEVKGSGLGLSIVQKSAELHGGSVRVESEKGKGSKFFVSLKRFPVDSGQI